LSGARVSFAHGLLAVVLGQAAWLREQAEAGDFMLQAAKKDKESVQILLNAKTEVIGTLLLIWCLWLFTHPCISGSQSLFVVGVVEEDIRVREVAGEEPCISQRACGAEAVCCFNLKLMMPSLS
jgi:hypothetical protein